MEDDSDGGAKVEDGLKDLDSGILPREAAIVIKLAFSPLKNFEAKLLLENPPKDKVSTIPPNLPKAGEVYIYSFSESIRKGKV